MKRLVLIGVAIVILLSACISCALNAEKEIAAITIAEKWLALIDTGKYSNSWQEADENFRSKVPQDKWIQILQIVRTPMGKVISRKLETKVYKTSLPGAPDGHYVIIQYITSFQDKRNFTETVVSAFDKDGRWRVLGYNIQFCSYCYMKMVID